jgi:hypothetical protein
MNNESDPRVMIGYMVILIVLLLSFAVGVVLGWAVS